MRRSIIAAAALLALSPAAWAQDAATEAEPVIAGQPYEWQMGLQAALSPVQEQIHWFNDFVLFFIVPITILVAALLGWVIWRYSESRNPTPSRVSHNTLIEVIWTVAPVVVLLFIAIPSFQLLSVQYNPPREPELTIKATGYQWYWGYEYQPAETVAAADGALAAEAGATEEAVEPVSFESYTLADEDRATYGKEDRQVYPHLLAVDQELVVPVDTVIRILSTSADVIHSFALPSMGVKVDSVPGRLNEYWFEPLREGIFYGQCSELCGTAHYNMPIGIRVVSKEQFAQWYAAAGDDLATANEQLNASIEAARSVDVARR